jgi:hypothetical protein
MAVMRILILLVFVVRDAMQFSGSQKDLAANLSLAKKEQYFDNCLLQYPEFFATFYGCVLWLWGLCFQLTDSERGVF